MIRNVINECKQLNKEYNYFNIIQEVKPLKKGELDGLLISVKDLICVKDVETTASSDILRGYKPVFDATVVKKVREQGATIIGKTVCDTFGFGSFNTNVGNSFKIPKNPVDPSRVTGGSSGGGAGVTKSLGEKHAALVTSTGGSIECPASFCGVIGFCPTYGLISRNGLIDYANSLDKIGIMSTKVNIVKKVFDVIKGHDSKDNTSIKQKPKLFKEKKLKIGLIKESLKGMDDQVKKQFNNAVEKLKSKYDVEEVSLDFTFRYGIPTYYILATSEASTNLAKLSGMRYGVEETVEEKSFNEYFTQVRSKNFNEETKRRIMLGTFARMSGYRDAYYLKATKVRTLIIKEYKKLFKKYDVLISPTMPVIAPKFEEVKKMTPLQNYMMDILTVGPNIAGIPHASIPVQKEGLPVGLMAMCDHLEENKLFYFLKLVEESQ